VSVDLARVRRGTHAARRTRVQGYGGNRHGKEVTKSQLGFSDFQSQTRKQMVKSQFFKYPLGNLRRKEYRIFWGYQFEKRERTEGLKQRNSFPYVCTEGKKEFWKWKL